jgi:hypothetical protein
MRPQGQDALSQSINLVNKTQVGNFSYQNVAINQNIPQSASTSSNVVTGPGSANGSATRTSQGI